MIRTLRNTIGFGLFMALFITACATTKLTSAWKDPAYQKLPRKIMVIGLAKKPVIKRIFEDEFVRQIKVRGINAIAGYTVMADWKQGDHDVIAAKMKEHGADAVLITRLVSKKTVKFYMPGNVYYPPVNYGNWRDYYGYGSQAVYTPGYMAEDEYAIMETNLYNAANDKLIWAAASETVLLGTDQEQIISFIGVMVNAMDEYKVLR